MIFNSEYTLRQAACNNQILPDYVDGFDAPACQTQDDFSVIRLSDSGHDEVPALHLCFPNHWAAEDKIGKGFAAIHQPVPDMDKMNQTASLLVEAMIYKGPYVGFAWGISTDTRLNHHPEPANEVNYQQWQGRHFNLANPALFLRIERQTLHGFPEIKVALFTIRTYFLDISEIQMDPHYLDSLIPAINSMTPENQAYKGLVTDHSVIIQWLSDMKSCDL